MDKNLNLDLVNRSNILVREESRPGEGNDSRVTLSSINEKPGSAPPFRHQVLANIIPILKALVILTLFLLEGVGYSPLGCKTQYLLSSRYWYNKQVVIFFIIYFVINLGGDAITKLTNPIQQLIISIVCLFLYNIIGRLGDIWWNKNPWYWPGPMTWFAVIALPLVMVYIFEDIRRYYMVENAIIPSTEIIDNIKKLELWMIIGSIIFITIGFFKSWQQSATIHGKYFSFLAFFFGVPMGNKKTGKIQKCNAKTFIKIEKSLKLSKAKPYHSNVKIGGTLIIVGAVSIIAIIIGYLTIFKNYPIKLWKKAEKKIRDKRIQEEASN